MQNVLITTFQIIAITLSIESKSDKSMYFCKKNVKTRSVVPNRVAAAHKGAVKSCQGCHQILNLLLFLVLLLLRVPQIVILSR